MKYPNYTKTLCGFHNKQTRFAKTTKNGEWLTKAEMWQKYV